jgi:hypothetical protein
MTLVSGCIESLTRPSLPLPLISGRRDSWIMPRNLDLGHCLLHSIIVVEEIV